MGQSAERKTEKLSPGRNPLAQPILGLALEISSLTDIKTQLGRQAKLSGEGATQTLTVTLKGKDPVSGKRVTSDTTLDSRGFVTEIRSSRPGQATTVVTFEYRPYEEITETGQTRYRTTEIDATTNTHKTVDAAEKERMLREHPEQLLYEVAKAKTSLEVTSGRRGKGPVTRYPIEVATFPVLTADAQVEEPDGTVRNIKVRELDRSFERFPDEDQERANELRVNADAGAYPTYGALAETTQTETIIAKARALEASRHPSFKVINFPNGSTVVEVLKPGRGYYVGNSEMATILTRTFDKQGRITSVENYGQPLRPGIELPFREIVSFEYSADGYMTRTVRYTADPHAPTSGKGRFIVNAFTHTEFVGPTGNTVRVVAEMKSGQGADESAVELKTAASLDTLATEPNLINLLRSVEDQENKALTPEESAVTQLGWIGIRSTNIRDESMPDGSITRHFTMPGVPDGQEILIRNVGTPQAKPELVAKQ